MTKPTTNNQSPTKSQGAVRVEIVAPDRRGEPDPETYYINPPGFGWLLPDAGDRVTTALSSLLEGDRPRGLLGDDLVLTGAPGAMIRLPSGLTAKFRQLAWPIPDRFWVGRYDLSGACAVRGDVLHQAAGERGAFDVESGLRRLVEEQATDVWKVEAPLRLVISRQYPQPRGETPPTPIAPRSVSAIIPYRDRPDLMRGVAASLARQRHLGSLELVLVDNQSDEACRRQVDALCAELLPDVPVRHLRYDAPFNHSVQSNMGAEAASGDVLLFLNNDVAFTAEDDVARLAAWASLPGVASCGPRIVDQSGTLMSNSFEIARTDVAWIRESRTEALSRDVRLCIGNSFACAAVSRVAWNRVGPLDGEAFPADSNDADFAVRALRLGLDHIYAGDVEIVHETGGSGPRIADKEEIRALFRERNGDLVVWRHLAPEISLDMATVSLPFWQVMSAVPIHRLPFVLVGACVIQLGRLLSRRGGRRSVSVGSPGG